MTLTIVNHCHDGKKRQHRTFITIGKPNGTESVLRDHDYHHSRLPSPYFSDSDDAHTLDGSAADSSSASDSEKHIPSLQEREPSGFFEEGGRE
jgi:hypothetical protein